MAAPAAASPAEAEAEIVGFGGFEVVPKTSSPSLGAICRELPVGLSMQSPCEACGVRGDVMVSLFDNRVLCGRHANGCALKYCPQAPCKLVLSFLDLSVWDYGQEAYLDVFLVPEVQPHFNYMHEIKFGEPASLPPPRAPPPPGQAAAVELHLVAPVLPPAAAMALERSEAESFSLPAALVETKTRAMAQLDLRALRVLPEYYGSKEPDLHQYRMCGPVSLEHKAAFLAAVGSCSRLDRATGAMVGMAIADAVGAPLEFLNVTDTPHKSYYCTLVPGEDPKYGGMYNKFALKPGQWTDDASMGLCMADSLLARRGYDGSDIRIRFHNWWNQGYNNAFRKDGLRWHSVGLGGNISQSILSCREGFTPTPTFERKNQDAGNGSLMRLAPIPVCFHKSADEACRFAAASSYTTHPGPLAAEACAFMAFTIVRAIHTPGNPGEDPKGFLDAVVEEYLGRLAARSMVGRDVTIDGDAAGGAIGRVEGVDLKCDAFLVRIKGSADLETVDPTNLRVVAVDAAPPVDGEVCRDPSTCSAIQQITRLLNAKEDKSSLERNWNWRAESLDICGSIKRRGASYNGYPVIPGYFGAFCMDGTRRAGGAA